MSLSTRVFSAFVWTEDASRPSRRLTVVAWDEADARDQLLRLLGDGARWAIWAEPNIRRMHAPRGTVNTRLREFKAIVWAGSPETPGQRLSVWARGHEEARRLIEDQHGPEIMAILTDEEDVERTRRR